MGKASIKGKLRLVNQLRDSGLIYGRKRVGMGATQDRIEELKRSLEYYKQWKEDNHLKYEGLYSRSRFTKDVRYPYQKSAYAKRHMKDGSPDIIFLDYYDNRLEERKLAEEKELLRAEGKTGGLERTGYVPVFNNGINFIWEGGKRHDDLLSEMNDVNEVSKQLNKIIELLQKEIILVEEKIKKMKKLYSGVLQN